MIFEAIPNISEGRDQIKIEAWGQWWDRWDGVDVLDYSSDPDHHRCVFTLVGEREPLIRGLVEWAGEVLPSIDLKDHCGVHPRTGVVDVLPLVPLGGTTMPEAVEASRELAEAIANQYFLPVFLYARSLEDQSAKDRQRGRLAGLRRGGLEALSDRMARFAEWRPDYGPSRLHPQWGASAVGARDLLVACNVLVSGDDLPAVQSIARSVRESNGGLPGVQAIGFYLDSREKAQISMNLVDISTSSVPRAVEEVTKLAKLRSLAVDEVELIGLVPRVALAGVSPATFGWRENQVLETRLEELGWVEELS